MRTWMDLTTAEIAKVLENEGIPLSGSQGRKADFAAMAEAMLGPDPDHPALVVPEPNGDGTLTYRGTSGAGGRTIHQRMIEVMRKVGPIAKDARNVQSQYAARSIDDVMDELHGIMAAAGVFPVPEVLEGAHTKHGKMQEAILRVRWRFTSEDGDEVCAVVMGEALDASDKATNKALQASLKYLLLDTFLIPVGGQDDADTQSPTRPTLASKDDLVAIGQWINTAPEEYRDAVRGEAAERFGRPSALTDDQVLPVIEWIKGKVSALAVPGSPQATKPCDGCEGTGLTIDADGGHEEIVCPTCGGAKIICVECLGPPDAHEPDCSLRPFGQEAPNG